MIGLTLKQLRYFDALARHQHFGHAAEACAISQPALSLQIKELESSGEFPEGSIVTEVVPFEVFYDAEDYHQDYERKHPNNPYIQGVSIPRLKRFQKKFPELLKH